MRDTFSRGAPAAFRDELERLLSASRKSATGRVSLVGAGPGDPELLTLKAQRKLKEADVIVYDRLVGPEILEYARRDAMRIPVGKTPGKPSPKQADINAILMREAKAGRHVVRLKGGDPYVFGRGGEEQRALEAQGIPVEVVPGVTAALACAASIGLPLTMRGRNQSITILTGASEDGLPEHDWKALAKPGQTLAIYMGVGLVGSYSGSPSECRHRRGNAGDHRRERHACGGAGLRDPHRRTRGSRSIKLDRRAGGHLRRHHAPGAGAGRFISRTPAKARIMTAESGQVLTANRLRRWRGGVPHPGWRVESADRRCRSGA